MNLRHCKQQVVYQFSINNNYNGVKYALITQRPFLDYERQMIYIRQ